MNFNQTETIGQKLMSLLIELHDLETIADECVDRFNQLKSIEYRDSTVFMDSDELGDVAQDLLNRIEKLDSNWSFIESARITVSNIKSSVKYING